MAAAAEKSLAKHSNSKERSRPDLWGRPADSQRDPPPITPAAPCWRGGEQQVIDPIMLGGEGLWRLRRVKDR